ncbi:xanthine phosphoribosyltransferase [Malonomonas rubra DSM 5091]|uniref:Xanthine phosphoribosyltransferase n=1 Tax=Malonomonas rubra DSM 5091 TaxID=1122189 RepID=A0A1M6F861_MALRU|nr:phosphoribosyltransferase family protein [Malonomonas rubra]SHI93779.1 xanthine phosphoribosyltransferase [Malonomonas rubra DSM 5091]
MRYASQTLLERIKKEGRVEGNVIKVDRFLNHMVDPQLIDLLATDVATHFMEKSIEKVLTAETSGIMLAQAVAGMLGVPFVYAKKKRPLTMGDHYAAASYSFTKEESTTLYVAKEVLRPRERILFIDDFFAKGSTLKAVEEIVEQAEAMLVGTAVIINKSERNDIYSILTLKELQG